MKKIATRISALLLAILALFSFAGCAQSAKLYPTPRANKVVATAGDIEITYDELYYLVNNTKAQLEASGVTDKETLKKLLADTVKNELLNKEHAMFSLAADYGVYMENEDMAENIDAHLASDVIEPLGGAKAYRQGLEENFMTDGYMRRVIAQNYLPTEVVLEMIERGELNTSDAAALAVVADKTKFARTVHVYIKNGTSIYTEEQNYGRALSVATALAEISDPAARYQAMKEKIKDYSNDLSDTLGNGNYFVRGEMEETYEDATFRLDEYDVSGVVKMEDGYCVIMRLPPDPVYVQTNLENIKSGTYFVKFNAAVDQRYEELKADFALTKYGESLDLLSLPKITPNGGMVWQVLKISGIVVLCVGFVVVVAILVNRYRKGRGAKSGHYVYKGKRK